jgi:hypothetical protein
LQPSTGFGGADLAQKIGLNKNYKGKTFHKRNKTINVEGSGMGIFSNNAGIANLKDGIN